MRLIKIKYIFFVIISISLLRPVPSLGAGYSDFMRLVKGKKMIMISEVYDLGGRSVPLEKGSSLQFIGKGKVVNGQIIGNESSITKSDHGIAVRLSGTWHQNTISDLFFDWSLLDDNTIIKNIEVLQSDDVCNIITLSKDKYYLRIEKENGYCIYPSSNSDIRIDSRIGIEPNDFKSYNIIYIHRKHDVKLSGQGTIVGDVGTHSYVSSSSSEWGMGIKIEESTNVSIANLTITKCIGDGIYITGGNEASIGIFNHACRNVIIENVTCDDNRRQGISVIHVDGLTVSNCTLINTGLTEFTKPGSGIDIEPNVSNGRNMSVRNIHVSDCRASGNKQYDYVTSGCAYVNGIYNFDNVCFSRCYSAGVCYFTSPVIMTESEIGSLKLLGYDIPIDVIVSKTIINDGIDFHCPNRLVQLPKGEKIINSLLLTDCKLNFNYSKDVGRRLFRRMAGNMENVGLIRVINTEFNLNGNSNSFLQMADTQLPAILVANSVMNMPGVNFLPQNNGFKDVTFKCNSVYGFEGKNTKTFDNCKVEKMGEETTVGFFERILFLLRSTFVNIN